MLRFICMALLLTFSTGVFASQNLDGFTKRFNIVKNESGDVTYVRMNFVSKFSLKPYLTQILSDLKSEISRMQSKSYDGELEQFLAKLEEGSDKSEELAENIYAVRKSLKNLKDVDVDAFFSKLNSFGIMDKFSRELKDALMLLDLSVVASTEDARYFYKKNVTYEVVKRVIDFAKSKLDNVPLLNLVSFVMVEVHELVLEQRLFHQNMLLHYLQNVSEAELGLTVSEADHVFSSIYESRISAINLPESNSAANNWDRYGLDKFYAMVRMGNNTMRRNTGDLDEVGDRLSYAFFDAVEDGETVVKNLFVKKHSFSKKMATAYNYDKPNEVKRFRSLLNLGQVGLGFLPLPGWLKGQVESFIKSYYVEQKRLEGGLVAHFEINNNFVMAKKIKAQLMNPYIQ